MKIFRNNFKFIIGFLIGVILASSIAVYASINASEIEYKNGKKVSEALDELYGKKQLSSYEAWPVWMNVLNSKSVEIPASSTQTENMLAINTNPDCTLVGAFNGAYFTGGYDWRNAWMPVPSTDEDEYIGYNFNKPVMLYKMALNYSTYETTGNYSFVLEGKKENGTWEQIGDEYILNTNSTFTTNNYNINNTNFYYAYRIKNSYSQTGNGKQYWGVKGKAALSIGELQFYCVE